MILTIATGCRFAVGITFFVAFAAKALDFRSFARGVVAYRLLPGWLTAPLAAALAAAEAAVAVCLLGGWFVLAGAALALALCTAFAVAVSVNLARRARIPCHCFGTGERISGRVLTRIGLLAAATAILTGAGAAGTDPAAPAASAETVLRIAVAAGFVCVAQWVLFLPDVVRLLRAGQGAAR